MCFTEYLDQMIQDVIINAHLSLNLVSHESFKTLNYKGYPGRTVLCRQTLMSVEQTKPLYSSYIQY